MTKVFHAWLYGRFIDTKATSGERNFIERLKVQIFLEAVLTMKVL